MHYLPPKCGSPFYRTMWLAGALLLSSLAARADVKLPALFGDHMVLQQEATLPVWGWAEPGFNRRASTHNQGVCGELAMAAAVLEVGLEK